MDYRDTGLSSRATKPYNEVDDLAAVLIDAGVHQAVLLGCSDGGRRALAFAHQHPSRYGESTMERMGHAQITTTQKYLHALPDTDAKNLEALDRIRGPAR